MKISPQTHFRSECMSSRGELIIQIQIRSDLIASGLWITLFPFFPRAPVAIFVYLEQTSHLLFLKK